MFVVGLAGCVFVIPIAAYRMFSVLFENREDEVVVSKRMAACGPPAKRNPASLHGC
jgi:hypothetical protein